MKTPNRTVLQRFAGIVVCTIIAVLGLGLYSFLIFQMEYEPADRLQNLPAFILSGLAWGAVLVWVRGYERSKLHAIGFVLLNGLLYALLFFFLPEQKALMSILYMAIVGAFLSWIYEALLGKQSQATAFLAFMSVASVMLPLLILNDVLGLNFEIVSYLSMGFWQIGMGIVFSLDTVQDRQRRVEKKHALINQIGKDDTLS
ncbi:MAG: hypothetical protein AB8F95_16805 [Bacteroidia bacterium]